MNQPILIRISGRIPSAKNSKRLVKIKGRMVPIKSKAYARFLKEQTMVVIEQMQQEYPDIVLPMTPPYTCQIDFKMKGKGASDGDNMEAAIFDLLQEAGVIEDDRDILICRWYKELQAEEYETDIVLKSHDL